ncbi:DUF1389 domain-containing protein [Candidatus Chlamydia sanziniae]|uniref:Uncharacterized protein n=1 Tax=Candidatus Chlamydia sanziniae TaxID=1806891 RepID=A0A1A9HVR5_9CHLA|nr:DUF1389 domain-containing protein [Candidatus Chlamydia sanziniae]ANH79078.1 hypothetical protein Cs308_0908 [Candidatus Chlamydia sanziniae]
MSNISSSLPAAHLLPPKSPLSSPKVRTILFVALAVLLAIGAILAFVCLAAPIAYIVGSVALVLFMGTLTLLINNIISLAPRKFPDHFMTLLRDNFPPVICKFVEEQSPTLGELFSILSFLETKSPWEELSESIQSKINAFGYKHLIEGVAGISLCSLRHLLRDTYPLYRLKEFVSSGSSNPLLMQYNVPIAYHGFFWLLGMTLLASKTAPLFYKGAVINLATPCICQGLLELSPKKRQFLRDAAQNNAWDTPQVQQLLEELEILCKQYERAGPSLSQDPNVKLGIVLDKFKVKDLALALCIFGTSDEQLSLLAGMRHWEAWDKMCDINHGGRAGKAFETFFSFLWLEDCFYTENRNCSFELLFMDEAGLKKFFEDIPSKEEGAHPSLIELPTIMQRCMQVSPYLRKKYQNYNSSKLYELLMIKLPQQLNKCCSKLNSLFLLREA